jgi:hypothetical protein
MTIKYDPPALGAVINGKRVKSREGYVTFQNQSGEIVAPCVDGLIPKLYEMALVYDSKHPKEITTIHEWGCVASGLPSPEVIACHVKERMG